MIRRGWILTLAVLLSMAITSAGLAAGDAQREKPIRIVLAGLLAKEGTIADTAIMECGSPLGREGTSRMRAEDGRHVGESHLIPQANAGMSNSGGREALGR